MNREALIHLFAPAINEALGTPDFDGVLVDICDVERFLNGDHPTTLELENEE